eukprot:TRINITY_DN43453_c0_g1_i1.p1 TRINITY_DN43453_c0_g1~~TRINITY_DN43453_c0_g1_i1.p1  ORF type:complete len:791 (+),score=261.97 TRINITY_DN43453_c0_g1_i1:49-2421(+)
MHVFAAAVAATCQAATSGSPLLQVKVDGTGGYNVLLNGATWLASGTTRAFVGGEWRQPQFRNASEVSGADEFGNFTGVSLHWELQAGGSTTVPFTTVYKDYGADMAAFEQLFPHGAPGTQASRPKLPGGTATEEGAWPPVASFPSFRSDGGMLRKLGYITWQGCMVNIDAGTDVTDHSLRGLSSNGPVLLHDGSGAAVVVSPANNFKSAVHTLSKEPAQWETGISSELESLPPGFSHRTLLVAGQGLTSTMKKWGDRLRAAHGTERMIRQDKNVNFLSYWTDNGAYYYGDVWGEAGGGGAHCNEGSMVAVAEGLRKQDIPIHIWQLDDWWYPGRKSVFVHCVQNWTLGHPAFSSDLKQLSKKVGAPWLLYVPFLCRDNVWSAKYRFVNGSDEKAPFAEPHPDDALAFYRELFDYGVASGMESYENDFLNYNLLAIPHFRQTFGASEKWLAAINTAAAERQVPVQMCMALPSDLMESVRMNSVTNFRASSDYAIAENYNVGGSSLIAYALDLRPSKDNFWTHRPAAQPYPATGNPGQNCELNTLLATLSTGPVGISDMAGDTNATLVFRAVRKDGVIVQPDKPATSVDRTFLQHGGSAPPAPSGHVWGTYASVGDARYLVSIDVTEPWKVMPADLWPAVDITSGWVARNWFTGSGVTQCVHGSGAVSSGCVAGPSITDAAAMPTIHNTRPGAAGQNDTMQFDLLQLVPVMRNGFVLLGDISRYVSVSSKRFSFVEETQNGVRLGVMGQAGEQLTVTVLQPASRTGGAVQEWTVVALPVTIPASGTATVSFP